MNNTFVKYEPKRIDPAILSVHNVDAAGKVVTAETWKELWGLVITSLNHTAEYCVSIDELVLSWHESESNLQKIIESFNKKYDVLRQGFIHYGEEPPEDDNYTLWVQPVKSFDDTKPVTKLELLEGLEPKADKTWVTEQLQNIDAPGVGAETPEGGEIFNDYENNKALSRHSTALGTNSVAGIRAFTIQSFANDTFVLDSVEGLEVEDVFSVKCNQSYINVGAITEVYSENTAIVVSIEDENTKAALEAKDYLGVDAEERAFFVIAKPSIGTSSFDGSQYAEGIGNIAVLYAAHAEGARTQALDRYAHAEGRNTVAHYASHAEGYSSQALASATHAEGYKTQALKPYSHAEGMESIVNGQGAHTEGGRTNATNNYAHAEGYATTASGENSHTEGDNTQASAISSHAEGSHTTSSGVGSHSEGIGTEANGEGSHSEGIGTEANGVGAHAEGCGTRAIGKYAHAEGNGSNAAGENSHAEGIQTTITADVGHAEGVRTNVEGYGSHAEGYQSHTIGAYAHAEGKLTEANGEGAHAEGLSTKTNGVGAHAEGRETLATNTAHAEGVYTEATGWGSHAGGVHTKASQTAQRVIGLYNNNKTDTLFEVGNGTAETLRSNAFEVFKDGSISIGGIKITPAQLTKLLALIAG